MFKFFLWVGIFFLLILIDTTWWRLGLFSLGISIYLLHVTSIRSMLLCFGAGLLWSLVGGSTLGLMSLLYLSWWLGLFIYRTYYRWEGELFYLWVVLVFSVSYFMIWDTYIVWWKIIIWLFFGGGASWLLRGWSLQKDLRLKYEW